VLEVIRFPYYITAMFHLDIYMVAFALACDAFSVAIGVGTIGLTKRRIFRLSFHFGLFQFFMPLIGLSIGGVTASLVGQASKWIAAGLLVLIGFNMFRQVIRRKEVPAKTVDPSKGWSLILLSISTSIDALVAGFSIGLLGMPVLTACIIIGVTAAIMTIIGMLIGAGTATILGNRAEAVGGIILIILAIIFVV